MSLSVDTAFVKQYEREAHLIFQREGSSLLPSVRRKPMVVGTTTTFQKIGSGVATTKARNGVITPMNQDHTAIEATMVDFYAGDFHDKLDEAKINHDEKTAIAKSGAWALGRKVDDQVIAALNGTTQSTVTIVVTSAATVRAGLLEWVEALYSNDVMNDGNLWGIVGPRLWSQMMSVKEFNSADFVMADGMRWTDGAPVHQRWRHWMGVNWKMHTALPGTGTATANGYVYHTNALGYGINKFANNVAGRNQVAADITWEGTRAAWWINHMMSGGAALIDDTGVIECVLDDTAAIVTT